MTRKQNWTAKLAVALAGAALALATFPAAANALISGNPMSGGGPGGSSSAEDFFNFADISAYDYRGDHTGTLVADGEEVTSEGEAIENSTADENVVVAKNGGTVRLTDCDLTKTGDVTVENNSLFYGVNSALNANGENTLVVMNGGTIECTGYGANAVTSVNNSTVYIANVDIHTNAVTTHGIDSTYAGVIIADNLNIHTETTRSAPVATDRGGGTVSISNSTIEANGDASPLVYSTGDVQFYNVTGKATGSQIAVVDNMNTFMAYKSDITTTFQSSNGNSFNVYKSVSGDAETMTGDRATLQLIQTKVTTDVGSGTVISVKGNDADIYIGQSELVHDAENISLINVGAGKGMMGGASASTANMTLAQETVAGDIICENSSVLVAWFTDATEWTGAANITDPTQEGTTTVDAPITFNIDETSTWIVTADSVVSNLNVANGGQVVDEDGKTVSIMMNGDPLVEGDSDLTVTVLGAYSTNFDDEGMIEIANDKLVDRADFDAEMGLETAYTMELAAAEEPVEEPTEEPADTEEPATEPEEEPTEEPAAEPEKPAEDTAASGDATPYIIGGVAAAAVIAGVVAFFVKKNKAAK